MVGWVSMTLSTKYDRIDYFTSESSESMLTNGLAHHVGVQTMAHSNPESIMLLFQGMPFP